MSGSHSARTTKYTAERVDGDRAVDVARLLVGGAGEVDRDAVAANLDGARWIGMSAGVMPSPSITSRALPRPVGEIGQRSADAPLRVAVQLVHAPLQPGRARAAAASSRSRRAPSSWQATCARRSASRWWGRRMFATSTLSRSSVSRTGGITTPSWISSRAPTGMLAGCIPPTSAWWARETTKPRSSTRETSVISGRWVPPVYGSFRMKRSPGVGGRAPGRRPRRRAWRRDATGMCSACATIRPRASNTAVEQSRRSLMLAECAARTSAAPISSATPESAADITRRVAGSIIAEAPTRRRRNAPASRRPPTAWRLPSPPPEGPRTTGRLQRRRHLEPRYRDGGGGPHRHQLDLAVGIGEPVAVAMGIAEPVGQGARRLERHRQLERLAVVAQIAGSAARARPVRAEAPGRGCAARPPTATRATPPPR